MEECLKAASIRAGLQADVLPQALEYQRTLTAKQASFGISLNYSCVICLHLAAVNLGKNVAELKWMVRIAGAKSKPHYLQTYQNAEKVLQITSLVSIQEVCVQVTASHLAESAASVMTSYEDHLVQSLGEASAANLNLGRAVYPCAAVVAAAKIRGDKIDLAKITDISKVKKKDLQEIVDEMLKLQPKSDKKGAKRNLDLMDKIMGASVEEEKENSETGVGAMTKREKIQEEDFEDDGFEEWKQTMFKKAIDNGFKEYKKYLKVTN